MARTFSALLLLIGSGCCRWIAAEARAREEAAGVSGATEAAGAVCRSCQGVAQGPHPAQKRAAATGKPQGDWLLLQQALRPSKSTRSDAEACLCVFDVDRTLTSKQSRSCPGNSRVNGVWDDAYGGGELTLSALATAGLGSTFCGACYVGVCSAGLAGGHDSWMRRVLVDRVLMTDPQRALLQQTSSAARWSRAGHIHSPFVVNQPDKTKHQAVEGIVAWYRRHGVDIPNHRVHFFGDRTENIPPFRGTGFNAREISCTSRDAWVHQGLVGRCGATPQEIVSDAGVLTCSEARLAPSPGPSPPGPSPPGLRELDSSPGQHGHNLQACQGDCDRDEDCVGGLRCFQRDGEAAVPGCHGRGTWDFDYCYEPAGGQPAPPAQGPPLLDSSPGRFANGAPLSVCQGDCDHDGECAGGLRCFHREHLEPVPGCGGEGVDGFDYCTDPSATR